jgi:hypothetical protein
MAEACRGHRVANLNPKIPTAGSTRDVRYVRTPRTRKRRAPMGVFLLLEASQPCGTMYRVGLGCFVHPKLASMLVLLMRLF